MMAISTSRELNGKTVIDGAGNPIGEVEDVLIDDTSWRVSALRVKLRREAANALGERQRAFHSAVIDVPAEAIGAAGQTVVLNVPVGQVQQRLADEDPRATDPADLPRR
jgi:sporulation protein YlmC with PRC-barrel domain